MGAVDNAAADELEKAADILEANGLYKGDFYDARQSVRRDRYPEDCHVCAMGAINTAATGTPSMPMAWEEPYVRLHELYKLVKTFLGVSFLDGWNDAEERTEEEVVAALRGTAAAVREGAL